MCFESFAPFDQLSQQLLRWLDDSTDGSHDLSHLARVWRNARAIAEQDGGDLRLLVAAVVLHDCVTVEKDSPLRGQASRLSAERARRILAEMGWRANDVDIVADAVLCHSFLAGLTPKTLEGRVLQDADRLDAIGMVGIARCFYTAGRLGSKLYEPGDPTGTERSLDDGLYALDHFPKKLLGLSTGFTTRAGRLMAERRHARLQEFYDEFVAELQGSQHNAIPNCL